MGSEKYAKWTKITVEEMKAFLGFSVLMGINQLPAIENYWKNDYLHYSPLRRQDTTRPLFGDLQIHPLCGQ